MNKPVDERDWYVLVRMIQDGSCILLLGPGIERDPQPPHDPLTVKLAQKLADQLDDADAGKYRDNLASLAEIFRSKNGRLGLEKTVLDFYDGYAKRTTDVHRKLATLPFKLWIDITHGGFLAYALSESQKQPQQAVYWLNKEEPLSVSDISPDRPLIYKLLGSVDQPGSLLLTENDLLDFLVHIAKNKPPLPSYLTSHFRNSQVSFLFLGFGFQQWYFRILLHVLKAEKREDLSLALEDDHFFTHPDMPLTALFYDRQHRIQFRHASWLEFAEDLSRRFTSVTQGNEAPPPPAPLPEDAPKAFLCYCSDDAEAVVEVSERLKALGVRPWVDQDELRGGDLWDQMLEVTIKNVVNYFVVLVTPAMLARNEGYYYKEIGVALEREKYLSRRVKFIFPAKLEQREVLLELADHQHEDLNTPDGVEKLAKAILDDWKLRHDDHHE